MSFASYHELEAELAGVERALQALDEGTYGQCEVCGQLIDAAVLELSPTAAQCPEHQDPGTSKLRTAEAPRTADAPPGLG